MFYNRMTQMTLAKPTPKRDELGFPTATLTQEVEDVWCYVVRNSYAMYQTNELDIRTSEYTGYTYDPRPQVGWLLGDKYTVTDVQPYRGGYLLSLDSLGDPVNHLTEYQIEPTVVEAKMAWEYV